MITQETKVDIRFYHQNGLSFREISRKTGLDRRTVKRYAEDSEVSANRAVRPSKLDAYKPMIMNWLKEDSNYRASWILDQITKLGYSGGYTILKDLVHSIKEENSRIAYVRFETEPGRQAQVDFGEFKVEYPNGSEKTFYLLSIILGYSRMLYGEFLERCDMESFLDAHQRAFEFFCGVP